MSCVILLRLLLPLITFVFLPSLSLSTYLFMCLVLGIKPTVSSQLVGLGG